MTSVIIKRVAATPSSGQNGGGRQLDSRLALKLEDAALKSMHGYGK